MDKVIERVFVIKCVIGKIKFVIYSERIVMFVFFIVIVEW